MNVIYRLIELVCFPNRDGRLFKLCEETYIIKFKQNTGNKQFFLSSLFHA